MICCIYIYIYYNNYNQIEIYVHVRGHWCSTATTSAGRARCGRARASWPASAASRASRTSERDKWGHCKFHVFLTEGLFGLGTLVNLLESPQKFLCPQPRTTSRSTSRGPWTRRRRACWRRPSPRGRTSSSPTRPRTSRRPSRPWTVVVAIITRIIIIIVVIVVNDNATNDNSSK